MVDGVNEVNHKLIKFDFGVEVLGDALVEVLGEGLIGFGGFLAAPIEVIDIFYNL